MKNGTSWIDPVDSHDSYPNNLRFFGEPSQEIDDNWHNLIDDRYFFVTEEEAENAWGEKRHEYLDPDSGEYIAG